MGAQSQLKTNNPFAVGCLGVFLMIFGSIGLLTSNCLTGIPNSIVMLLGPEKTTTATITSASAAYETGGQAHHSSGTSSMLVSYTFSTESGQAKGSCLTNHDFRKGEQTTVSYVTVLPGFNCLKDGFNFSLWTGFWSLLFTYWGFALFRFAKRAASDEA